MARRLLRREEFRVQLSTGPCIFIYFRIFFLKNLKKLENFKKNPKRKNFKKKKKYIKKKHIYFLTILNSNSIKRGSKWQKRKRKDTRRKRRGKF